MTINLGVGIPQYAKTPLRCEFKKGPNGDTITIFYEDGSKTSVTCKDGKYTKSGSVKKGNLGAYMGSEISESEAKKWLEEEMSKLTDLKLNLEA